MKPLRHKLWGEVLSVAASCEALVVQLSFIFAFIALFFFHLCPCDFRFLKLLLARFSAS